MRVRTTASISSSISATAGYSEPAAFQPRRCTLSCSSSPPGSSSGSRVRSSPKPSAAVASRRSCSIRSISPERISSNCRRSSRKASRGPTAEANKLHRKLRPTPGAGRGTNRMNLARSLGSVGGLTFASRVLGLVRDMLFAQFVGANFASDAFAVAWRMPNMFRALFAEGAFSAAFIPMFNRKVADKDGPGLPAGIAFAEDALSVLLPSLVAMTLLLELLAWPATYLISLGFHGASPEQFAYAVMLTRFTFPSLMLISLASLLGGILNSLQKFWVAAAAPILLDLAQIVALVFFHTHEPLSTAKYQAISVTIG